MASFEIMPNDLSARTNPRVDRAGRPCVLIKVYVPDRITEVRGSYIGNVEDHGMEKWVYVTDGTKEIEFLFEKHYPLHVKFVDHNYVGVGNQMTYVMKLREADGAPRPVATERPDAAAAESRQIKTVKMAADKEPLLPPWWNTADPGVYVGVSAPTYDAETAKTAAILNAIAVYAQRTGAKAISKASELSTDKMTEIKNLQKLTLEGFSIKILHEYYNARREYFVLCSITKSSASDNKFTAEREFKNTDDFKSESGYIRYSMAAKVSLPSEDINGITDFEVTWNGDNVTFRSSTNDIELINNTLSFPQLNDNLTEMYFDGPIGQSQLRLIALLPAVIMETEGDIEGTPSGSSSQTESYAEMAARNLSLRDYKDGKTYFAVKESFPEGYRYAAAQHPIPVLSAKYSREYLGLAETTGMGNAKLAEISKNVAYHHALNMAYSMAPIQLVSTSEEALPDNISFDNIPDRYKWSAKSSLKDYYPLWYLDPDERVVPKDKKERKMAADYQRALAERVTILVPLQSDASVGK